MIIERSLCRYRPKILSFDLIELDCPGRIFGQNHQIRTIRAEESACSTLDRLVRQVFSYKVNSWDATKLEAVAKRAMGECLERRLVIHIPDKSAALSWSPPNGCEGDTGRAVLVGDPL